MFDTHRTKDEICSEILKCVVTVTLGPPGLKGNQRCITGEGAAYDELIRLFGEEVDDFMIVAFAHVDGLRSKTLEETIARAAQKVRDTKESVRGGYGAFSNADSSEKCLHQGDRLLQSISKMVNYNEGTYFYTSISVSKIDEIIAGEIQSGCSRADVKGAVVHESKTRPEQETAKTGKSFLGNRCSLM